MSSFNTVCLPETQARLVYYAMRKISAIGGFLTAAVQNNGAWAHITCTTDNRVMTWMSSKPHAGSPVSGTIQVYDSQDAFAVAHGMDQDRPW